MISLRPLGHLTPRYLLDRLRFEAYQRQNSDKPWLTPAANGLLGTLIQPTDNGIEWGSGRSTAWFASRLHHLVSVEDNREWFDVVSKQLGDDQTSNVDYRFAPITESDEAASRYVRIVDEVADGSLQFALVDGKARVHCAHAVIPKLAPGSLLVIDNINWFLDHPTHSPASRFGKGPADEHWAHLRDSLAGWRMMWTTSGVTDTAIWIKPGPPPAEV